MLVSEFIRRKNEIIFEETGITLVPESQIEECRQVSLSMASDGFACPYCAAGLDDDECENCPMELDGNGCNDYVVWGTWEQVKESLQGQIVESVIAPKIEKLIEEYNSELEGV